MRSKTWARGARTMISLKLTDKNRRSARDDKAVSFVLSPRRGTLNVCLNRRKLF